MIVKYITQTFFDLKLYAIPKNNILYQNLLLKKKTKFL